MGNFLWNKDPRVVTFDGKNSQVSSFPENTFTRGDKFPRMEILFIEGNFLVLTHVPPVVALMQTVPTKWFLRTVFLKKSPPRGRNDRCNRGVRGEGGTCPPLDFFYGGIPSHLVEWCKEDRPPNMRISDFFLALKLNIQVTFS